MSVVKKSTLRAPIPRKRTLKHREKAGSLGLSSKPGDQIVVHHVDHPDDSMIITVFKLYDGSSQVKLHISGDKYEIVREKLITTMPADLESA